MSWFSWKAKKEVVPLPIKNIEVRVYNNRNIILCGVRSTEISSLEEWADKISSFIGQSGTSNFSFSDGGKVYFSNNEISRITVGYIYE